MPLQSLFYDFRLAFLPAAKLLCRFEDPYKLGSPGFFSPPWVLYPILPLTLLPEYVSCLIWMLINIGLTFYALERIMSLLGWQRGWKMALILGGLMVTPWSIGNFLNGQLVAFVLVGFMGMYAWKRDWLAPIWLLSKPHMGYLGVVVWTIAKVRGRTYKDLGKAAGILVAGVLPLVLIAPGAILSFPSGLMSGGYTELYPHMVAGLPALFQHAGFASIWAMVPMAIAFWLTLKHPTLPVIAAASLLVTPYMRGSDYLMLLPCLAFLLSKRWGILIALFGVAYPVLCVMAKVENWLPTEMLVPLIFFVACWIYEDVRDRRQESLSPGGQSGLSDPST